MVLGVLQIVCGREVSLLELGWRLFHGAGLDLGQAHDALVLVVEGRQRWQRFVCHYRVWRQSR